ncbi:L,D-transpeptidase family protein [Thermosipho ferrireducens]|uniref:L,D-transpeptidase family protein n=2 Tax=Thermosipho ferrireducens TaxID=2571116 RepID=A0ABX7S9E9_9BACT|nr:L,D-transpeptidase family protein [Thermosipho ferrireducens]
MLIAISVIIAFSAHKITIESVTSTGVTLEVIPYYETKTLPRVYVYGPTGFQIAKHKKDNLYSIPNMNSDWLIPIVYGTNVNGNIIFGSVSKPILYLNDFKSGIKIKVLTNPDDLSMTVSVESNLNIFKAYVDDLELMHFEADGVKILFTDKKRGEGINILRIFFKLPNNRVKRVEYKLFTLAGYTTYLRGDSTPYVVQIKGIHKVQRGENLWEIATKYGVRTADLQIINNLEDPDKIYPGMKIKIGIVQFTEGLTTVVVNLSTSRLAVYYAGKLVKVFPVAIGRSDAMPPGNYWIYDKRIDPALYWYGEYIPPSSPINGLGTRYLQFSDPTYGIHGTSKPWEIGRRISHGCVRMNNKDVEALDAFVDLGSPVIVIKNYEDFPQELEKLPEFIAFRTSLKDKFAN